MEGVISDLVTWEAWLPRLLSIVSRLALVLILAWGLKRLSRPLTRRLDEALSRHRGRDDERQRRAETLGNIAGEGVSATSGAVASLMGLKAVRVTTAARLH